MRGAEGGREALKWRRAGGPRAKPAPVARPAPPRVARSGRRCEVRPGRPRGARDPPPSPEPRAPEDGGRAAGRGRGGGRCRSRCRGRLSRSAGGLAAGAGAAPHRSFVWRWRRRARAPLRSGGRLRRAAGAVGPWRGRRSVL